MGVGIVRTTNQFRGGQSGGNLRVPPCPESCGLYNTGLISSTYRWNFMLLAVLAVVAGLVVLVWSADRFVDGAAATARHFGMPALLIGMVIVGFGTSAPEMVVSALAASQGNPGIALGNAYGSNITNIALILGLTAVISPIAVQSQVVRKELPILALITALAAGLLWDNDVSRSDALILLGVFASLMTWTVTSFWMRVIS